MNDKPPRQSIRTLIRKAYKARYNVEAVISQDLKIRAPGLGKADLRDWSTARTPAGSVCLRHRGDLFFRFGPDA